MDEDEACENSWSFPDDATRVRRFIYEIIESKSFGILILLVILFNTVVLLLQTEPEWKVRWGWWFSALDFVFLAIYQTEFFFKYFALRWHYFQSWANIIDFGIVLVTLLDFVLPFIVQNAGAMDTAALLKLVRVAKSIKAIRAVRVLRTIRFLNNVQVIFNTVLKSIRALSTIAFLAMLVIYMFAVIGRGLFSELSPKKFANTYAALVTLIQLMTLDAWFEVFQDVNHNSRNRCEDPPCTLSWVLLVYMIIFIFLQYFIILNLIVAVIVDNFQRTLDAAEVKAPKKASDAFNSRRTAIFTSQDSVKSENVSEMDNETDKEDGSEDFEKPCVEDYYPEDQVPETRDRQLLHNFLVNLNQLEYNIHQSHVQQKLLDDLVDITVGISEVPEDLI